MISEAAVVASQLIAVLVAPGTHLAVLAKPADVINAVRAPRRTEAVLVGDDRL